MYTLSRVEIDGVWGKRKLEAELYPDINIFIGPNGTGKTTLINALQASLSLDLTLLNQVSFHSILLRLSAKNSTRTIQIEKIPSEGYFDYIEYRVSREKFRVPLITRDVEYRRRVSSRHIEEIRRLRKSLSEIVETCWLSVHREILHEEDYEIHLRGRRVESVLNPIDARLKRLLELLQGYQLRLQSQANELSMRFQRSVLASLLYNKSFDTFDLETEANVDFDELKGQLVHAYEALGALNEPTQKRIDKHIEVIRESISTLIEKMAKKKPLHVNDILPLSLYKRTRQIAKFSTQNEAKKQDVFSLSSLFAQIINGFLEDKEIILDPKEKSGLLIVKGSERLSVEALSSGEKQLLILLAETLLQERRSALFLADEPELSLHIAWQRKLLSGIRTLNPNAQIIVATHSPEIAGEWESRMIDMADVLK